MTIKSLLLTWNDPATGDVNQRWINLPATIGRGNNNNLQLRSDAVSRQHVELTLKGDEIQVKDLGSTNGTYLNGQVVQHSELLLGDTLYLGSFLVSLLNTSDLALGTTVTESAEDAEGDRATVAYSSDDFSLEDLKDTVPETDPLMIDEALKSPAAPSELSDRESATIQLTEKETSEILDVASAFETQDIPDDTGETTITGFIYLDTMPQESLMVVPPPPILEDALVKVAELKSQDVIPVEETTYLSLGAGVGSFCWIDYLRVSGVPTSEIRTIGFEPYPLERYRRLCQNSQIPDHERLRSDSGSTPDNIWGYPGYAVREIASDVASGNVGHAAKIAWQIFSEPVLSESYTPISGRVFESVDREAARIGWEEMMIGGRIRNIRKTDDGRYVVFYHTLHGSEPRYLIGQYVHMSLGYPGFRLLDDLTTYRKLSQDFKRVVNAYEDHNHVYDVLAKKGGSVLLRGRGIVASRLIQRIYEIRQANPDKDIKIINLLRSPLPEGHRYGGNQRLVENHWELQPYNWPKSAFGGNLKALLEDATPEQRDQLLNDWGGTTTADRTDWRHMIRDGLKEGWYDIRFGAVSEVKAGSGNRIETAVKNRVNDQLEIIYSDYVIDATGLNASLDRNPILKDLLNKYDLPLNIKGRLKTDNQFEMVELRNGNGRFFATGAITFGNGYAPVDSFVGLQYAAGRSMETLLAVSAPHVQPINPFRSLSQYMKWIRGVQP